MRCKHYFYFDSLIYPINKSDVIDQNTWNQLRVDTNDNPFALEDTKEQYEENCVSKKNSAYATCADYLCMLFEKYHICNVVSLGVGKGILEWHLKNKRPQMQLTATDYTKDSLDKLKKVSGICDDYFLFDFKTGDYSLLKQYDCLVLYRLSTELDFEMWKQTFEKMSENEIKQIVFVPTELLTFKMLLREKRGHITRILRRKKDMFCGWMYSEKEFKTMWSDYYYIEQEKCMFDTKVFFLKMK
ncbi:MAG: hypothetical protein IIX48_04260 [Lachnospiraceae bacterium]|nr:hypothetical protein [Lachnospiraceae bacterium]